MHMIMLALTLLLPFAQTSGEVSPARKKAFIEMLKTLPHKGEFFTDEGIDKANPYLPVLLALTEKDIEDLDIYPFVALSNGLCGKRKNRRYVVRHFAEIRHPVLKLFWSVMLFDANIMSPSILRFLNEALANEKQTKWLVEGLGPGFAEFKKKLQKSSKVRK